MSNEIVIALIAASGGLMGSLIGLITNSKLIVFRIDKLEEKVDKHNQLVERMAVTENTLDALHERLDKVEGR